MKMKNKLMVPPKKKPAPPKVRKPVGKKKKKEPTVEDYIKGGM